MSEPTVVLGNYPSRVAAELAAARLRAEGIDVTIVADDVGGTYPALGRVRLRVAAEDEERARALVLAPSPVVDEAPGEVTQAERAVQQMDRVESRGWPSWLPATVVVLAMGYVLASVLQSEGDETTWVEERDRNGDFQPDAWFYYDGDVLERSEHDRNFDGEVDQVYRYGGRLTESGELDEDFDGAFDVWIDFEYGYVREWRQDLDGDGVADTTFEFEHGVAVEERLHPAGGPVERVTVYEAGAPREVFRVEPDGRRTLLRSYDEAGREQPAP